MAPKKTKDPRPEIKTRFFKVVRTILAEQWCGTLNEQQLAEEIGFYPQQIYNTKKEKGRHITTEMIHNLCVKFNINPNYIIVGQLPMRNCQDTAAEKLRKIENILKN